MEQLFTNRRFHFCSHRNFRVFFLNGKRPLSHPFLPDLTCPLHFKSIFPRALLQPQPQKPQLVLYQYQSYWFHFFFLGLGEYNDFCFRRDFSRSTCWWLMFYFPFSLFKCLSNPFPSLNSGLVFV